MQELTEQEVLNHAHEFVFPENPIWMAARKDTELRLKMGIAFKNALNQTQCSIDKANSEADLIGLPPTPEWHDLQRRRRNFKRLILSCLNLHKTACGLAHRDAMNEAKLKKEEKIKNPVVRQGKSPEEKEEEKRLKFEKHLENQKRISEIKLQRIREYRDSAPESERFTKWIKECLNGLKSAVAIHREKKKRPTEIDLELYRAMDSLPAWNPKPSDETSSN